MSLHSRILGAPTRCVTQSAPARLSQNGAKLEAHQVHEIQISEYGQTTHRRTQREDRWSSR